MILLTTDQYIIHALNFTKIYILVLNGQSQKLNNLSRGSQLSRIVVIVENQKGIENQVENRKRIENLVEKMKKKYVSIFLIVKIIDILGLFSIF